MLDLLELNRGKSSIAPAFHVHPKRRRPTASEAGVRVGRSLLPLGFGGTGGIKVINPYDTAIAPQIQSLSLGMTISTVRQTVANNGSLPRNQLIRLCHALVGHEHHKTIVRRLVLEAVG